MTFIMRDLLQTIGQMQKPHYQLCSYSFNTNELVHKPMGITKWPFNITISFADGFFWDVRANKSAKNPEIIRKNHGLLYFFNYHSVVIQVFAGNIW